LKIYTKSGDKGQTSLVSGRRVDKTDILIEAYGTIDELNAHTGLLHSLTADEAIRAQLHHIQHLLFNIGSILAQDGADIADYPEIRAEDVTFLETSMDDMDETLPKMTAFILPTGSQAITQAHICRTTCRRAERRIIGIYEQDKFTRIVQFVNRLSDYFFVLSRYLHIKSDIPEYKWDKNPR